MKQCLNCGKMLKERASFCDGCGAPVNTASNPRNQVQRNRKNSIILILVLILILLLGVVLGAVMMNRSFRGGVNEAVSNGSRIEGNESISDEQTEKPVKEDASVTEPPEDDALKDSENILTSMTSAEYKEVNLFLSNFSEAGYNPGSLSEAENKIMFAYTHNIINNSNFEDVLNKGYIGISASLLDRTLNRFFGSSIPHQTPADSKDWFYEDGNFMRTNMAGGDTVSYFTVATDMTKNPDGTYSVDFNVYYTGDPHSPVPSSNYTLSTEEADRNNEYKYSGSAVLKAKVHNGSDTYEIVSYEVY